MARYFFHLHECGTTYMDEEGQELSSLEAARQHALVAARSVMSDEVAHGRLCISCRIEVTGAGGEPILEVAFQDAVAITGA